jgi:hypothetical protein
MATSKIYLFKNDKYIQIDAPTGTLDFSAPSSIGDDWSGLKDVGFDTGVDAAAYCQNRILFFKGGRYAVFDAMSKSVTLDGATADYIQGLPHDATAPGGDFTQGIDAALYYAAKGTLYLFKGNNGVVGNPNADPLKMSVTGAGVSGGWGWPYPYSYGIRAALLLNDNYAFVRGDSAHFYHGGADVTLECLWPGLRDMDFDENIDAAVQVDWELNPAETEPVDD